MLTRSRSNSHSGKKEPKSGEGNGSVIQDSGFSTETSSSKEAHSASSTAGSAGVQVSLNGIEIVRTLSEKNKKLIKSNWTRSNLTFFSLYLLSLAHA